MPDHVHDWFELVYIYCGKGSFFIDQTIYDIREGDLFIIPGNTIHRAMPDTIEPLTTTAIFFDPLCIDLTSLGETFSYLQCFERAQKSKNFKYLHTGAPSIARNLFESDGVRTQA
nr:AraC family ligand binding domain-containing protein [Paenibacillus pasadenensis]